MPARRRTRRRAQLDEAAERWLRGEPCGFFAFKPIEELTALWVEYGDPKKVHFDPVWGTTRPISCSHSTLVVS
jgi:hypothetical protein